MAEECCCPKLKKSDWDGKKQVWKNKAFYVAKHRQIFHMPIGIGKAIVKAMEGVKGYKIKEPIIMLDKEQGLFGAKMMIAVEGANQKDKNIETLSGTFYTSFYQGPYKGMRTAIKSAVENVKKKEGHPPSDIYFWYANCPKCAPAQGGPITVIFSKV